MKISWFRPSAANRPDDLDGMPAIIAALGHTHEITVVDEDQAHDFVWRECRQPSDLCVYELGNHRAYRFIWPYLFHYPGVTCLRQAQVHDSRAASLEQDAPVDHYITEFQFNHGHLPRPVGRLLPRGGWPMLRAPLLASRLVVVDDAELAQTLQEEYPEARLRHAPAGVDPASILLSDDHEAAAEAQAAGGGAGQTGERGQAPIRFALFGHGRTAVAGRALERAIRAGASATLLPGQPAAEALRRCDVVLALGWPAAGETLTPALIGMALGKPVVVFEVEATAAWPALDPQTGQPRGMAGGAPIVVSIDPRDEEHSLMLVIRRLAGDAALRGALGSAGHAWWLTHATADHAIEAWRRLLEEGRRLRAPAHPAAWPAHLSADGTDRTRDILREMGAGVDFLP